MDSDAVFRVAVMLWSAITNDEPDPGNRASMADHAAIGMGLNNAPPEDMHAFAWIVQISEEMRGQ